MKVPAAAYQVAATSYWMSRFILRPSPTPAGLRCHQLRRLRSILSPRLAELSVLSPPSGRGRNPSGQAWQFSRNSGGCPCLNGRITGISSPAPNWKKSASLRRLWTGRAAARGDRSRSTGRARSAPGLRPSSSGPFANGYRLRGHDLSDLSSRRGDRSGRLVPGEWEFSAASAFPAQKIRKAGSRPIFMSGPKFLRQPFASRPDGPSRGFPRPGSSFSEALRQLRRVAPRWKIPKF